MKIEKSKTFMNSDRGGEFEISLSMGDAFISFHINSGKCIGVYLKSADIGLSNLTEIIDRASKYFITESEDIEVKIIGNIAALERVGTFFKSGQFTNIKKTEKNEYVAVLFFPALNKVRVSKSNIVVDLQKKIKVLIVDDSKTIRTLLGRVFQSDPQFEVCGTAERPSEVAALIESTQPDVITLDIHMPEMDGVELLKIIAPKYNIPCVMISSISIAEGPLVLEALENGAVDYIQKPEMSELKTVMPLILEKVKTAAFSKSQNREVKKVRHAVKSKVACNMNSLIVLGASTGGTEAIRTVLTSMPNQIPPTLIVQHIPAVFSHAFATRMNELCHFEVKEAEDGDEVKINRVLIAPGGKQMRLIFRGERTFVAINDDAPVNRFKPSVDYLFHSVEKSLYCHTVAVLLTGMGKDGARGMLALKNKNVLTIAQDEATSVVYGMPREAAVIGAACFIEPLEKIAEKICELTNVRLPKDKAKSA